MREIRTTLTSHLSGSSTRVSHGWYEKEADGEAENAMAPIARRTSVHIPEETRQSSGGFEGEPCSQYVYSDA